MNEKQVGSRRSSNNLVDRILNQPGIKEAIALTLDSAEFHATEDAMERGLRGEFGKDLQALLEGSGIEGLDQFLTHDLVDCFIADSQDELLEDLSIKAGLKIADLWGLSASAGEFITNVIYWGKEASANEASKPLIFLVNEESLEGRELKREYADIVLTRNARRGRIYLDVTDLPYSSLRSAYKTITQCRDYLNIKHLDLRRGAPARIKTERALQVALLKRMGNSNKEIARQEGFTVYTEDNPSGSYSLLQKYLKCGREIEGRLEALEQYLERYISKLKQVKTKSINRIVA